MFDFKVVKFNSHTISKGVQIFAKAMNFSIDVEQAILEEAKRFIANKNFIGIGLQNNNNIVGLGSLIPMNGPTAWIPYVGMDPNFQGLGGGRLIMENLLTIAKNNNWKSVELVASHAGFPMYKKLGFRSDFNVAHYEIKGVNKVLDTDLHTLKISKKQKLPNWVVEFDKEHLGIDRSNLFSIHGFKHITVIYLENHAYGILYGTKIGPIISDSREFAREIISKGYHLGATSVTLPMDDNLISFLKENIDLAMFPNRDGIKMTYGEIIPNKKDSIFALRSMAFG